MYKTLGMMILLLLPALGATGCGNSNGSNSGNINGTWTANLTNPDNSPAFAFTTDFTQQSGSSISITSFKFTTSGSCFTTPTTETGSFGLSGTFNGTVTGTIPDDEHLHDVPRQHEQPTASALQGSGEAEIPSPARGPLPAQSAALETEASPSTSLSGLKTYLSGSSLFKRKGARPRWTRASILSHRRQLQTTVRNISR